MNAAILSIALLCFVTGFVESRFRPTVSSDQVRSAASDVVSNGATLANTLLSVFYGDPIINVTIEVENWTKWTLTDPRSYIAAGSLVTAPVPISPGVREAVRTQKSRVAATGSYGTLSWLIQETGRRMWVMWSVPYDYHLYSNQLAVGMSGPHYPADSAYDFMCCWDYGSVLLDFERRAYRRNVRDVLFWDENVKLSGSMGTNHKPWVRIIVKPVDNNNLAPVIKARLEGRA